MGRSLEALARAFFYRSLAGVHEARGESFGIDVGPAVLVQDGVARPPVRVLGRAWHTLQGVNITGTWSIEGSLDGKVFSPVFSAGGPGAPAVDPTATLVLSPGGCPPSPGGEMVITALGAGAAGNAFTVEVVWDTSSSVDFTAGHLTITLNVGAGDAIAAVAAALIKAYGGGGVFAVEYDDAGGLVDEQTEAFGGAPMRPKAAAPW